MFGGSKEVHFGPGFKVFRAVSSEDSRLVMYRMHVWGALVVHVCIDEETAKESEVSEVPESVTRSNPLFT
jgi:hypothetical protein